MKALQELIKNVEKANEALDEYYTLKNSGTNLTYAYNLTSRYLTDQAAAELATLTALLKEAGEALDTGQAFVLKMFEVYDDPQYLAAFSLLADHQGAYSGKTWTKEQNDFTVRAAEIRKKIQEVMG